MTSRKLNAVELKLHQTALSAPTKTLTPKDVDAVIPEATARTAALNFLLATGMLKALKDSSGAVSFRAVLKKEMEVKKDMSGEEVMVLSHIQAANNEGIWTKHLKAKTELHQTVIDRILKSLVQKQLVKSVKSVKHPTRKIYMLSHLEPSPEMTGGPWYTDHELDTEFIKLLLSACLHYIKDKSFPKQSVRSLSSRPLFPISAAPAYPTARHIQNFLSKSRITETELTVEHVEMLLNVLVLDGEIERVPAFGAAMWESTKDEDEDEDTSDDERLSKRRRKEDNQSARKKKRLQSSNLDQSSSEEETSQMKLSRKRRKAATDTSDNDLVESQVVKKKRRVKGMFGDEDVEPGKSRRRKSFAAVSESEMESDSSPIKTSSHNLIDGSFTNACVYRAIRPERIALGWSQAPCGNCPVFDFCKDKGPVNPAECQYFEGWLERSTVNNDDG